MAINQESFNTGLYDLLKTRGYNPTPIDSKGQNTPVPQDADIFKFDFKKGPNTTEDYGPVWVTIDKAANLIVYFDDDIADSGDDNTSGTEFSDSWPSLLNVLKRWAMRKQLGFELKNRDHLGSDMAQREYTKKKETIGESYHSLGNKASYNDAVPKVKIIIQHTRKIEEGEKRFRNVERIFVENSNGERFAIPTKRPGIAKVYARHVAEGGTPYDDKGKHITSLVEEYTKMAGFVRATRNSTFNESAQQLINEGLNHYQSLRETLSRMIGYKGYNAYFESWTPTLMETEGEEMNLNELFVKETLDPRIESVMPILKKLSKNIKEVTEVKELEEWANTLIDEATDLKTIPEEEEVITLPPAKELYKEYLHSMDFEKDNVRKTNPEWENYFISGALNFLSKKGIPLNTRTRLAKDMLAVFDPSAAKKLPFKENFINMAPQAVAEESNDHEEIYGINLEPFIDYVKRKSGKLGAAKAMDNVKYSLEVYHNKQGEELNKILNAVKMAASGLGEADESHTDEENSMASDNLNKMAKASTKINKKVKGMGNKGSLEPWQQQLVATAADKVDAVYHSLDDEELDEGWNDHLDPETNLDDYIERMYDRADRDRKEKKEKELLDKEEPPFIGGHAVTTHKDEYGNVIKHVAKHLARKAMKDQEDKELDDELDESKWRYGCGKNMSAFVPKGYGYKEIPVECGSTAYDGSVNQCEKCEITKAQPRVHDYGDAEHMDDDDIEEGLDANQKRVGQLGPTTPVGKNEKNLRNKGLFFGAESVDPELARIKKLSGN